MTSTILLHIFSSPCYIIFSSCYTSIFLKLHSHQFINTLQQNLWMYQHSPRWFALIGFLTLRLHKRTFIYSKKSILKWFPWKSQSCKQGANQKQQGENVVDQKVQSSNKPTICHLRCVASTAEICKQNCDEESQRERERERERENWKNRILQHYTCKTTESNWVSEACALYKNSETLFAITDKRQDQGKCFKKWRNNWIK